MSWLDFLNRPFAEQRRVRNSYRKSVSDLRKMYEEKGMSKDEAAKKVKEAYPGLDNVLENIEQNMPHNNPETG